MALKALNRLINKAIGFLPDRGDKIILDSDNLPLEFGRIIIERAANGKIRMKVGDGTNKYLDTNYIGEAIVLRNDPTTVAIGDSPVGTINEGRSFVEWLDEAAYAYQDVTLNSVSTNQPTVELGEPLNSSITISTSIGNIANLEVGDSGNVSSSPVIFPAQDYDPRSPITISGITASFNDDTVITITVRITGAGGEQKTRTTTINVMPKTWWGSSADLTIVGLAELKALDNSALTRSRLADRTFVNNYSHIGIPTLANGNSLVDISGISFVDIDINTGSELLGYSMDTLQDLIVVNDYGVTITYSMFRSTYPFGGATKFRVK